MGKKTNLWSYYPKVIHEKKNNKIHRLWLSGAKYGDVRFFSFSFIIKNN